MLNELLIFLYQLVLKLCNRREEIRSTTLFSDMKLFLVFLIVYVYFLE